MASDWILLRHSILYRHACQIIDAHLGDCTFDTADLVRLCGCSRATLYRAFNQQGLGVRQTIRERRLMAARVMLVAPLGRLTVEAIAYRCGFNDVGTFNRAFRALYGCNTRDYRCRVASAVISPRSAPGSDR